MIELLRFGNKEDIKDYAFSPDDSSGGGEDETKTSLAIDLDSITDDGKRHGYVILSIIFYTHIYYVYLLPCSFSENMQHVFKTRLNSTC